MYKNSWLYKPWFDIVFIAMPAFISSFLVWAFPGFFNKNELSDFWWILLILMMDVGHVYSTVFKTYFNKEEMQKRTLLFKLVPLICFVFAFMLYQLGWKIFWMGMAYMAVFHFVRQQYGFLKVYRRKTQDKIAEKVEIFAVYAATIYPLFYWHTKGQANFNWFLEGDFFYFNAGYLSKIFLVIYVISFVIFFANSCFSIVRKTFNLGAFLIVTGTYASWFTGIVYAHNDLAFTLTNVASHGIPYMAIVWVAGKRQSTSGHKNYRGYLSIFKSWGILLFLAIPLIAAFIEEGLWDVFIWKEHPKVFLFSEYFSWHVELKELKQLIVPLLVVPQLVHYLLDAFVWKVSKGDIPELYNNH